MTIYAITQEERNRVLRLADLYARDPHPGPLPSALCPRDQLCILLANIPKIEEGDE